MQYVHACVHTLIHVHVHVQVLLRLVCWDLLLSQVVASQSYGDLSRWPDGEQSNVGTMIHVNIRIGSHQF